MLGILLAAALQGAPLPDGLLPPPPPADGPQDAAYLAQVAALAAEPEWPWERIEALRARGGERDCALAGRTAAAGDAELRLLAALGSGCAPDGALTDAFLRRASAVLPEEAAVACLLAPERIPESWWAPLAHLAARPAAPLPVRAAAIARLIASGCDAAWPWARAVLLTGTARDEAADPFADWRRGGRYELPKRLIAGALAERAPVLGSALAEFEPNAAWSAQEVAVERIGAAFAHRPSGAPAAPPANWRALVPAAAGGDPVARRALALLGAARPALLREALASGDPGCAAAVRRALDERPR